MEAAAGWQKALEAAQAADTPLFVHKKIVAHTRHHGSEMEGPWRGVSGARQQPMSRRRAVGARQRARRALGRRPSVANLCADPSEWQKVNRLPCVACVLHLVLPV